MHFQEGLENTPFQYIKKKNITQKIRENVVADQIVSAFT